MRPLISRLTGSKLAMKIRSGTNRVLSGIRSFVHNPVYVVATIGLAGFVVDMLWKPISNAGLILLGLASMPWLTRLIKSAKLGGLEIELAPAAPPASIGARLAEEVAPEASTLPPEPGPEPSVTEPVPPDSMPGAPVAGGSSDLPKPQTGSGGELFPANQRLALAYLAEGLVLQDLQRELGGVLQRAVRLDTAYGSHREIDGLILTPSETVAVEIKLFLAQRPLKMMIKQAIDRTTGVPFALRKMGYPNPRLVIAIVSDSASTAWERRILELQDSMEFPAGRMQLRHFNLPDLLTRYGFSA